MTNPSVTWYVIADGGEARIVARRGQAFEDIMSFCAPAASLRAHERGTDRPGRERGSLGGPVNALDPSSDRHELDKLSFARAIAVLVNERERAHDFDRLVLVAPPKIAAALKARLDIDVAAKLVGELPKDLIRTPRHELYDRLREVQLTAA